MKSLVKAPRGVQCLTEILLAVLLDCEQKVPSARLSLRKDSLRLRSLIDKRGLPLYTTDLPALDAALLAGLETGEYKCLGLPLQRRRSRHGMIPRLFSGLYLLIFDEAGKLRTNADVDAIACLRQIFCLYKKYEQPCKEVKVNETLNNLYSVDSALKEPTLGIWDDKAHESEIPSKSASHVSLTDYSPGVFQYLGHERCCRYKVSKGPDRDLLEVIQQVADLMSACIGVFNPDSYMPKHGPGAVSEIRLGEDKYPFRTWSKRLDKVFPYCDYAFANYMHWSTEYDNTEMLDSPSRLIAVPKTQKGPRLIAAEPTANQWCQQIILAFLTERVRGTWICRFLDFSNQELSASMVSASSVTRKLATLDLSDASDCVSCAFVERLFRKNQTLLNALASCRTRVVKQTISPRFPTLYKLKKFSTMGSACTFPVESLGFLCVALGSALYKDGLKCSFKNLAYYTGRIRVYGDDIIVPSHTIGTLKSALTLLQFRVNNQKTFENGNFRESCGSDCYMGYDVTPVKVKRISSLATPEVVVSMVDASNNLHKKGWWNAASVLAKAINSDYSITVVGANSGAFGYKSYVGPLHQRVRFNSSLSRWEYQCSIFSDRQNIQPREGMANFVQWITEKPSQDDNWKSGVRSRPRLKGRRGWEPVELSK